MRKLMKYFSNGFLKQKKNTKQNKILMFPSREKTTKTFSLRLYPL